MSMNMNTNMGTTVYWHKNQVISRLKLQLTHSSSVEHIDDVIRIFRTHDPIKAVLKDLPVPIDVRLIDVQHLCPPDTGGNADLVVYHRINPGTQPQSDMESMQGNDDHTLAVVNQINNSKAVHIAALKEKFNSDEFKKEFKKEFNSDEFTVDDLDLDALPHWLNAGTPDTIQGCPISPPIPVEKSGATGWWKLQFSHLPDSLQEATGKGVTVLVLDTLPAPDQISRAAEQAGSSNMLLQKMANGMRWEEPFNAVPPAINCKPQFIADVVEGTPSERVVTGKDIYGRHVGFPMEDHGLFIAGILRDLAPEANIECIRVLNDSGVGDISTLNAALKKIYHRVESGGDLYQKPVVINLSLVVLPPEDDIPEGVTNATLTASQHLLYTLIQCLADQGAIFVAAAGNDSDPRMNASEKRFGPRYPAALACDDHKMTAMISVGAVNRNRDAAVYSNYPGTNGVASYGGDLPKPDPWLPSAMKHVVAHVDTTHPIDALCGVYTAAQCPALSKNDPDSEYPVPNSKAWAYWSGTSFATPIISALAARVLQGQDPKSVDVREVILDAAMDEVMLTTVGVDGQDIPGPMIMAEQAWYPPVDPPNSKK